MRTGKIILRFSLHLPVLKKMGEVGPFISKTTGALLSPTDAFAAARAFSKYDGEYAIRSLTSSWKNFS